MTKLTLRFWILLSIKDTMETVLSSGQILNSQKFVEIVVDRHSQSRSDKITATKYAMKGVGVA